MCENNQAKDQLRTKGVTLRSGFFLLPLFSISRIPPPHPCSFMWRCYLLSLQREFKLNHNLLIYIKKIFKVILNCIISSRPIWTTWDPNSKNLNIISHYGQIENEKFLVYLFNLMYNLEFNPWYNCITLISPQPWGQLRSENTDYTVRYQQGGGEHICITDIIVCC